MTRPKSLLGLTLLGFAVVAAPLIAAVIWASVHMDRIARDGEQLVVRSVELTQESQQLADQVLSMERTARLYQVLGDPDLQDLYRSKTMQFSGMIHRLREAQIQTPGHTRLESLSNNSRRILTVIGSAEPDSDALTSALTRFPAFKAQVDALVRDSEFRVTNSLEELRRITQQGKTALAWQAAALVPLTLVMSLVFTVLIARPIRQIDRAIRELGSGALNRPIAVSGPTDLETLGRQLEWLRLRLLEQDREKNKFLRHMSHELKTPLASIREGTELLIDGTVGELGENQREVADILRDNGMTLQTLIENLLSFSAWQAKAGELNLQRFNLTSLTGDVLESHQLALNRQRLRLNLYLDDVVIEADREKLRMVLDNLISNAVKFTPPGGVVTIATRQDGDDALLEVADNGPGVPAEESERVFKAFYQAGTRNQGHLRGTGIGLSVVKECVNAHGGSVEVGEAEGGGARFTVRLPAVAEVSHG